MLPSTETAKLGGNAHGFDACLPSLPAEMSVPRGLAMCLAGSAGVLLSLWACRQERPRGDAELRQALVEAFGPLRPVEGRLAGVPYAPLRPGGRWPKPQDDEDWKQAVKEVAARAEEHPSPDALANQALVEMAFGELKKAAQYLEKAVDSKRAGARVWSDLSALRLALAENDPQLLVAASVAADKAVALDGNLPEARFNRATIAGRLGLRSLGKGDWGLYLKLDPSSGWAQEARRSLDALNKPTVAERWEKTRPAFERAVAAGDEAAVSSVVAEFPDRTRDYLEVELLSAWARAVEAGDAPQAVRWVRAARPLASRLLEATGDRFDSDGVAAIEGISSALARELAHAHLEYAEGAGLYRQGNYTAAQPHFAAAVPGFDRARSPFLLAARTKLAACDYQTREWRKGLDAAGKILRIAQAHGYSSLIGYNDWLIGVVRLESGETDPAGEPLEDARRAFHRIRDAGSEASIRSLLANRLGHLGKDAEAWGVRRGALAQAATAGDSWPMTAVFGAAARVLSKENLTVEAIHFQREVLSASRRSHDVQRVAEADWGLAAIYRGGKDMASARSLIGQAESEGRSLPDPRAAQLTLAGIAAEAGRIWLDADPRRAAEFFNRALDLYGDNAYSRADVLLGRARAYRELRKDREAESDLVQALAEYEAQRGRVQPTLRASYFETARDVLGELIALEHPSNPDAAFDYAERAKARLLLDSLAARHLAPAKPLATAEVERSLKRGTVLVEYAVLPDQVVVWTRGAGRASQSITWVKADLEKAVANLSQAAAAPSGDPAADAERFESLSGDLFDRLLAPVLGRIPQGDTLVVVPDGVLRDVPFAALRDRQSRKFLVERNPLVVAPSATLFLATGRRPGSPVPRERWRNLAVGDAAIDSGLYPEHGPLPHTGEEAHEVASIHPGSLLLVQRDATVPRFLAELDRFELIHFAGHALVAPPARAALLLAPAAASYQTGALFADTIAAQHLTRPRLAVLAACSAAGGSRPDLEGGADLARSFFEAGVPAVVGNLWTLSDEEAKVFLDAFYGSFWRGRSAPEALREAQLAMIRSSDAHVNRPAVWGGFRLLGTAAGQSLP